MVSRELNPSGPAFVFLVLVSLASSLGGRLQEDQLGAIGLVVNVIVLWNTLYINAALQQLAREGYHATPEDVARLSPLVFEHINLLGCYAFSVPEAVTRGELRPLRNPAEAIEEVA